MSGLGFPVNKDLWICPNCGRNPLHIIRRGIGFFLLGFFLLMFLVLIVKALIASSTPRAQSSRLAEFAGRGMSFNIWRGTLGLQGKQSAQQIEGNAEADKRDGNCGQI